jgi:hypothetical protein
LIFSVIQQKINAREIVAHQAENDRLGEDDVIVERLKLNYAMNDENPVDHVKFYNQYKPDEGHYLVTLTRMISVMF